MPNILPGLDKEWEICFETFKQMKDKPDSKEFKEMDHGKGNFNKIKYFPIIEQIFFL